MSVFLVNEKTSILPSGRYSSTSFQFSIGLELCVKFYLDSLVKKISLYNQITDEEVFEFKEIEFKCFIKRLWKFFSRIRETLQETFHDKLQLKYEYGRVYLKKEGTEGSFCKVDQKILWTFLRAKHCLIAASKLRLRERYVY